MKGRGPRPKIDERDEFVRRLRDGFRLADAFGDAAGWWRDAELMSQLGGALAELCEGAEPEAILAPQSRGMLVGALVAQHLGIGLIELRKETDRLDDTDGWLVARTPPDHRDRNLELGIRRGLLAPGTRVLFVDDWIETGARCRQPTRSPSWHTPTGAAPL